MSLQALGRALGLGAGAGAFTWGYNEAAKRQKLGQSAPYVDPPAVAGSAVAVTTLVVRLLAKNPFIALGAGSLAFTALCLKGADNDTIREKSWDGYFRDQKIPSKEFLMLEIKGADDNKFRKETAERLLKDHYS
jgi:hypothetical protein